VKKVIAPINESHVKKEQTDDNAVASTSRDQHLVIKREESIDIKDEPLTCDEDDCSMHWVSYHTQ
jgi:hypothetical protein